MVKGLPTRMYVEPRAGIERRLLDRGAARVEVVQADAAPGEVTWVVLADPEGNEFCVLRGINEQETSGVP